MVHVSACFIFKALIMSAYIPGNLIKYMQIENYIHRVLSSLKVNRNLVHLSKWFNLYFISFIKNILICMAYIHMSIWKKFILRFNIRNLLKQIWNGFYLCIFNCQFVIILCPKKQLNWQANRTNCWLIESSRMIWFH